ncbi:MAG: D-alanine--poly(phosphoribitol) ligase subunit DltC [Anaerovoracaceae bacterium]
MEEKILDILVDICGEETIKEDREIDLLQSGLMDSLDYTELLIAIEDNFGVVLAPSEVAREDVNTPNKIIELVKSRI